MIIVLMGVAGSGKTTVGQELASRLGVRFLDADSLHPSANVAKMAGRIPLTDEDRAPWLESVHSRIVEAVARNEGLIVACSALKQKYRDVLASGVPLKWVYLRGSASLILERLKGRQQHFMKPAMLASQFSDLEEPTDALVVDIAVPPATVVEQIVSALGAES